MFEAVHEIGNISPIQLDISLFLSQKGIYRNFKDFPLRAAFLKQFFYAV